MKKLNQFIVEKFRLSKDNIKKYDRMIVPETRDELVELIRKLIKEQGINANLNNIDISKITDMSELFAWSEFNGDISEWDVSNVKNMEHMFDSSKFNGDISGWDVSNVKNMEHMFDSSKFNGDISQWDISNVKKMNGIFRNCPLEKNPPAWYKK